MALKRGLSAAGIGDNHGKRPPATLDDLVALRSTLRDEISTIKKDTETEFRHLIDAVAQDVRILSQVVAENRQEAKEARDKLAEEQHAFTLDRHASLKNELDNIHQTLDERFRKGLSDMEKGRSFSRAAAFASLKRTIDGEVAKLARDVAGIVAVRWSSMGCLLGSTQRRIDTTLDELKADTLASIEAKRVEAEERADRMEAKQNALDDERDKRTEKYREDVQNHLDELDIGMQLRQGKGEEAHESFRKMTEKQLDKLRTETELTVDDMDKQVRQIRTIISEVENINTRRVEWLIEEASQKARPVSASGSGRASPTSGTAGGAMQPYRSVWSPRFEAAGAKDLQLELRILSPYEAPADEAGGDGEQGKKAPTGNCSLHMYAEKGLFLVFKLYVGSASVQLEHSFEGDTACSSGRLCKLIDQISQEDNTLRVGFEILEAVRQVTNPVLLRSADPEVIEPKEESGSLVSSRYLNHRVMELMHGQVELMRSRMVRRIEWRVEQASNLRKCFPPGEPLCSTPFSAAAVENLQLVFYPSGYEGAKEGHCSVFLHLPAGAAIRAHLQAGKMKREAKVSYDHSGYWGRTNFARFESCVCEETDSVVIVLEIEDAQTKVQESLCHQAYADTRIGTAPSGTRPVTAGSLMSNGSPPRSPPPGQKINSCVKMERASGRPMLEDVKTLPSIWTPRPVNDVTESLEGFHNFCDLPAIKRPPGSSQSSRPQMSRAILAERYAMYC